MTTKLSQEKLGSFSFSDLKFCPFCQLNENKKLKENISIKGHSRFKRNVLISVKADDIPPHVEKGFDMNPANCGYRVIASRVCTSTKR